MFKEKWKFYAVQLSANSEKTRFDLCSTFVHYIQRRT